MVPKVFFLVSVSKSKTKGVRFGSHIESKGLGKKEEVKIQNRFGTSLNFFLYTYLVDLTERVQQHERGQYESKIIKNRFFFVLLLYNLLSAKLILVLKDYFLRTILW